jgi:hypothetical protein
MRLTVDSTRKVCCATKSYTDDTSPAYAPNDGGGWTSSGDWKGGDMLGGAADKGKGDDDDDDDGLSPVTIALIVAGSALALFGLCMLVKCINARQLQNATLMPAYRPHPNPTKNFGGQAAGQSRTLRPDLQNLNIKQDLSSSGFSVGPLQTRMQKHQHRGQNPMARNNDMRFSVSPLRDMRG